MMTLTPITPTDLQAGDLEDLHAQLDVVERLRSLVPFGPALIAAGLTSDTGLNLVNSIVSTMADKTPDLARLRDGVVGFCEQREQDRDRIESGSDYEMHPSEAANYIATEYGELGYFLGLVVGALLGSDALGLRGGK
jgi:hypothetical protein